METLLHFGLKKQYLKAKKLRSRLENMKNLIEWEKFRKYFPKKESNMGRPPFDEILMTKCLFLQSWFTISDEELEYQLYNRLDFQDFLDFPEKIPDFTTIWKFRESLTLGCHFDDIWDELQEQIKNHNLEVKEGHIQDASFVDADPGKTNSGMQGRGREAKTSRSKDGSWTKKHGKNHFGFKLHTKTSRGLKIIETYAITTASTHDNKIDLADEDDIMYRDRGYSGSKTKAKGNATMKKGKLSIRQKLRNKRISKKRSEGEHQYGTIQRSFKGGSTKLTTIARVYVQQGFVGMAYNLHRLLFLTKS